MPCIPWFNRVDEDALEEAIRKTKSIRRTSKRATVPKKQEGSKEKPKLAANKVDVKDVQAPEERAQETHAGVQQVNEASEKVRPGDTPQKETQKKDVRAIGEMHEGDVPQRDTPQRDTQKRDARATWEMHEGDVPLRQMSARGSHERDTRNAEPRSQHGQDRRDPGGPSSIPKPSNIADDQEDNNDFDNQPRHVLKSSRFPDRRNLQDTEPRGHHILNRRPGGKPSRASGPYGNRPDLEEGNDFGCHPQSGAKSSRHLALSDVDDEGFEEELLRLHRLGLLGSLDHPHPHDNELRETKTAVHTGFNSRRGEGDFHIPGSFNKGNDSEEDSKDEEFSETQSHLGPGYIHRPAQTVYGENDPEAHGSRLRRLESLRHSYSPPVDQNQRPSDATRPARQTYNGGSPHRHVYVQEPDGREIDGGRSRTHHVSNRRNSLDPHNRGVDYEDDDEFPYMPPSGTRPSRRHSHHVAYHPPQNEQLYDIQRRHTSRRPAPDPQSVEAHPRTDSAPFQQEESIRERRLSDVLNPSSGQRISHNQRPDYPRRSASKSQSTRVNSRPHQQPVYQKEPPHRWHHDAPNPSYSQQISQNQRPNDLRHPAFTSRPTQVDSRPLSITPDQEERSHRRHQDMSCPLYGQRASQSQRPDNTRRSAPVSQPAKAPTRTSSRAPRQEVSRQSPRDASVSRHSHSVHQSQTRSNSQYPLPRSRSVTAHPKPSSTAPTRQRHQNDPHRSSSHSTTQTHQRNSSSQSLPRPQPLTAHPPRWGQAPSAPTRAPSTTTQRTETSRRSSSGPHLSQKTVLPRVIPRRD